MSPATQLRLDGIKQVTLEEPRPPYGYTPNAVLKVYHIPDKRRRAEAICRKGIAAVSERAPLGYEKCPICFGRVQR